MDTGSVAGRTSSVSEEMEGICVMPDMSNIKSEHPGGSVDDTGAQNVAMGIKFILPNRFDMNVCSSHSTRRTAKTSRTRSTPIWRWLLFYLKVPTNYQLLTHSLVLQCNSHVLPYPPVLLLKVPTVTPSVKSPRTLCYFQR